MADLLNQRFTELSERLARYCSNDQPAWEAGYKAIQELKTIFGRHMPRPDCFVKIDPTATEMQRLLPPVPEAPPAVNGYNQAKGWFALLIDAIRNHVPSVDFLDAAIHLKTLVNIFKNSSYTPEF